ncbi:hypothetical protein HPB48_019581 [Haemaphysalis longicornis]|uniref:PRA1 family protein n=1 Tax=Haemaphysalis longicornis TaxID=44386 RepID=A0A9J6FDI7_HAELO|nr:hypothetical protein HPB48_019581 [Haemaphysalis longicornis]
MATFAFLLSLLTEASWWRVQWLRVQPWGQFLDRTKFSMPQSAREAEQRMRNNWERFGRNYGVLFLGAFSGFVLLSPRLLLSVLYTAGVCKALKINVETFTLGGRMHFHQYERISFAASLTLYFLYANGVCAAVGWALVPSLAVGISHAAAYTPPSSYRQHKKVARRLTYD